MRFNSNITLENDQVKLIPLQTNHIAELVRVVSDPQIWKYTWSKNITPEGIKHSLEQAVLNKEAGKELPFVIIEQDSGQVAGTTRLGDLDPLNRGVEIGWTSLAPAFWRTGVNTACKWLLLQYCFEDLGAFRVQFSASGSNERSQKALERIGAVKEGVLRRHRIDTTDNGKVHDNVFFSILDSEWPQIKARLLRKMG